MRAVYQRSCPYGAQCHFRLFISSNSWWLQGADKLTTKHRNSIVFAIQIPCDSHIRCIASNNAVFTFVLCVIWTARTMRSPLIIALDNFSWFQPKSWTAWTARIQFIALSIYFNHSRCRLTWIRYDIIWTAFLIEIRDYAPATANAIMRNTIDRWTRCEIEYNDLIEIAWSLFANAIALTVFWIKKIALSAWILDACGCV